MKLHKHFKSWYETIFTHSLFGHLQLQQTCLCPEFYVLHTHSYGLSSLMRIPFDNKYFVVVSSGRCQLLSFLPVPYLYTMVVIQTNRCQLFAIRCILTETEFETLGNFEMQRRQCNIFNKQILLLYLNPTLVFLPLVRDLEVKNHCVQEGCHAESTMDCRCLHVQWVMCTSICHVMQA